MFEVRGGVYSDMSFRFVTPGTEECYGPFRSHEEAVTVWRGKMGNNIDTCEHRLFVIDVDTACRYHDGGLVQPDTIVPAFLPREECIPARAASRSSSPNLKTMDCTNDQA